MSTRKNKKKKHKKSRKEEEEVAATTPVNSKELTKVVINLRGILNILHIL